jgi:hypothetical protein
MQCLRFGLSLSRGSDSDDRPLHPAVNLYNVLRLETETSPRIDPFGICSRLSLSSSRLMDRHIGLFHIRPGKQTKGRRLLVQEFHNGQEAIRR